MGGAKTSGQVQGQVGRVTNACRPITWRQLTGARQEQSSSSVGQVRNSLHIVSTVYQACTTRVDLDNSHLLS